MSINNFVCSGNLTRDADHVPGEKAYTRFSIAINTWKEKAIFMNCVAFGKLGEGVAAGLKKGQAVACIGRLDPNEWEDSEGIQRKDLSLIVTTIEYLSPRTEAAAPVATTPASDIPF
jgi:single-strand DNA-binding protein